MVFFVKMKAIVGKRYNFKKDVTFLKTREKQQEEKNNNLKEDIEHMLLFVIPC